jgi:hypothetical protein
MAELATSDGLHPKNSGSGFDAHGKEFGIGRPYLGRDPPHVAPVDGQEYASHNHDSKHAGSDVKKVKRVAIRDDPSLAKRPRAAAASKMRAS